MQKHLKKISRLDPVIGIKQKRVDDEAVVLAGIRREKTKMESELFAWQERYLNGVGRLNAERESAARGMLSALESAVDHARETLFKLFQKLKEFDSIEHSQLSAVEQLQEVHRIKFRKDLSRQEQKALDEVSLRRFSQARANQ
jgi:flagellar biosynthesis chaperone FliJ